MRLLALTLGLLLLGCADKPNKPEPDRDEETPGSAECTPTPETCDGADNDCDGATDEDVATGLYPDSDGDGFGAGDPSTGCGDAPPGFVADATDCDDTREYTYPGAPERCDEADNDCDGETDEGAANVEYRDADGDGYGTEDEVSAGCGALPGYVASAGDCDDGDAGLNPDSDEICDGADNDCDGETDEPSAVDAPGWTPDADGDGYGGAGEAALACEAPAGYGPAGDCDDADPGRSPGLAEECASAADEDCDALLDCEDGDCAAAPGCYEECGDGADNDDDGAADCQDGECWGTSGCPVTVTSRVSGIDHRWMSRTRALGQYWVQGSSFDRVGSCDAYSGWWSSDFADVSGTLRIEASGAAATCAWAAQKAHREREIGWSWDGGSSCPTWSTSAITRLSFAASPGCPLQTSGFLPQRLTLSGYRLLADGATWYRWTWADSPKRPYSPGPYSWFDSSSDRFTDFALTASGRSAYREGRWHAYSGSYLLVYGGDSYTVTLPR